MSTGPHGLTTIAAGRPFLRDLAEGIVARFHKADDPLALSDVTIFLPTRRASRTLAEELVRAAGGDALVLPAIRVLGDVDEDDALFLEAGESELAPAIPRLERDLVLARLVDLYRTREASAGGYAVSLALARSLSQLIDEAANEDADLSKIADAAPLDMAEHWAKSVRFLGIAVDAWPDHLKEAGRLDPADRRARAIRAFAERLEKERPEAPFIAAGSSGSIKATRDLLKVIAGLPNGVVVLDALDQHMDATSWDLLIPSHPQFALKELLAHLGTDRMAVKSWLGAKRTPRASPRAGLLSEAMRPPGTSEQWATRGDATHTEGAKGLALIEAANEREEALAVALAIRETLETPAATVALVTPDRMLARRVAAELRRWEIDADDSAGRPLSKTEAGTLLAVAVKAAAAGGTPVALLSVLKHPCVTLGMERRAMLDLARRLERRVLRRGGVTGGIDDARSKIAPEEKDRDALFRLLNDAERALAPLAKLNAGTHDLAAFVAAHAAALEALTPGPDGKPQIWAGEDGEAAFQLFEELREAAPKAVQSLSLDDYAHAFDNAAHQVPVRPQKPRHPRVAIWGPLEARLHFADLVILGGLNEGVWPGIAADEPWLNRPMREKLDLPAPERRIGLSAHDFVTLAAQPHVLLTRARRQAGAPASPSRFLLRLGALAGEGVIGRPDFCRWAAMLDGAAMVKPAPRPRPAPPAEARPKKLSVTTIERWLRDPYEIYARHVLNLKPLDALEPALEARDRGTFIHEAAERFVKLKPEERSGDPYADLLRCGRVAFGAALEDPDVKSFWWPRFERAARWLIAQEAAWEASRSGFIAELRGEWKIDGIEFTLTGQPDRIDRLKSGGIRVIDFKTGQPPTAKQVRAFMAQLPLLALMARAGAFGDDVKDEAKELIYAQLSGGRTEGKAHELEDVADTIADVDRKLRDFLKQYADPTQPFLSHVGPVSVRYEGDYDHLARLSEWAEAGDEA